MTTTQTSRSNVPAAANTGESGFRQIPTRINNVPPLIIDAADEQLREQIVDRLQGVEVAVARTHRTIAEAYLSQGMYGAALVHLQAAARFAPEDLEYQNQLGFVAYVEGNDDAALLAFERVLAGQPDHGDALFNMGMVLFGRGEHEQAEECFRRSLQSNPHDAETWNNRGVCLYQMTRPQEARACFQQALQIDPANEDARANLTAL